MMKCLFLLIVGCLLCGEMKGQTQQLFDAYMDKVGDHSALFVGKVEYGYPPMIYMDHPYWTTDDFLRGTVVFNGLSYRNVWLRFDAYLQQLVVRTPVKEAFVCVPMQQVDGFTLEETVFVRRNGKFVALHFKDSRVELVEQLQLHRKERVTDAGQVQYFFNREAKFYVWSVEGMYEVDKLKSVLNLYPELKKELKAFAKKNRLNFKEHRRTSLVTMIKYAEDLLKELSN